MDPISRCFRFPDVSESGESWTQTSSILDPSATTLVQSLSSRHDASHTSLVLVSVYHYLVYKFVASWRAWESII